MSIIVTTGKPAHRFLTGARKIVSLASLAGVCVLAPTLVAAQADYPNRPLTLVVPYPPGGSTDMIARDYADRMGKELSQTVIVENRPGAGTNIGSTTVARANPDGYTLLFGSNSLILNPIFGPKPTFDGVHAFTPVSMLAEVPFMVAANPDAPFNNPAEMIAAAKARPGEISIASAQLQLSVEYLKATAGMNLLHVPYKGGAQSVTDTIAGQVDSVFSLTAVALPHVIANKLKPIAVSSAQRVDVLPDVPTFKESGVDYEVTIVYGVLVPKGTPDAVVQRLADATKAVAASEDLSNKLAESGVRLKSSSPAELADYFARLRTEWEGVAKAMPHLVVNN